MDIIAIIVILIVLIVILELAKHQVSKIIITSILIVVVSLFVLLFVTSNLTLDNQIDNDNPIISTGASVLKTIKNSELADEMGNIIDITKDKISKKDDF